jgi:hypothetical protein
MELTRSLCVLSPRETAFLALLFAVSDHDGVLP